MKEIVIIGSCVTRDAFELPEADGFTIKEYFARSSLSGLCFLPAQFDVSLDNINSSFQKRILGYELNKYLSVYLQVNNFDFIVYDPIDERFNILLDRENKWNVTLSNEMLATNISEIYQDNVIVESATDNFYNLWERGWARLIELLTKSSCLNKLIVNRVYWSTVDNAGGDLNNKFRAGHIDKMNFFLEKLYRRMEKDLPASNFINYPTELLAADVNHKWGLSPFHYQHSMYASFIAQLKLANDICGVNALSVSDCRDAINNFHRTGCSNGAADVFSYIESNAEIFINKNYNVYFDDQLSDIVDYVPGLILDRLKNIIENFKDDTEIHTLIDSSLKYDVVEISDIFSDGLLSAHQSFFCGGRNFVRFCGAAGTFFIVQHHKFCRAIYFPLQNVVILLDKIDLPLSSITTLQSVLYSNFSQYNNNFLNRKEARNAGVICSYARPYHYFYDSLPQAIKYFKDLSTDKNVLTFSDGAFFDVSLLSDFCSTELKFSSPRQLNDYLMTANKFFITPGYGKLRLNDFTQFDEYLIENCQQKFIYNAQFLHAKSCEPLLWFGVCSEKRKWHEQIEGIQLVIQQAMKRYPNVGFVFDGITSLTEDDVEVTRKNYAANEIATFEEIIKVVPDKSRVFDLIGATALKKIAFSSICDSFLTSFLTDSMYVARFAKLRGVGHGANRAMHSDHYHPNTYFVPGTEVNDDNVEQKNWSTVSYSINPQFISDYFWSVVDGVKIPYQLNDICLKNNADADFEFNNGAMTFKSTAAHFYAQLNAGKFSFTRKNTGSVSVDSTYDYYIRFSGELKNRLPFSLHIVEVSGTEKVATVFVPVNSGALIQISPTTTHLNLFIRAVGENEFKFDGLEITRLKKTRNAGSHAPLEQTENTLSAEEIFDYDFQAGSNEFSIPVGNELVKFRFHRADVQGNKNLLVFFNAALTRKTNMQLPAFSGSGAIGKINANILMIDDPSIKNENSISLAWYAGNRSCALQGGLAEIINNFSMVHGSERTVLYGGSGGGFAALYYGKFVPGAVVVAANPQTDISLYNPESVQSYLNECFPLSVNCEIKQHLDASQIEYCLKYSDVYKDNTVIYLQNSYDSHHMAHHLSSFFGDGYGLFDVGVNRISENSLLLISDCWGHGHTAPPRNFVYSLLEKLVNQSCSLDAIADQILELDAENCSIFDSVRLAISGNKLSVSAQISQLFSENQTEFAFYLLENGNRVEYQKYSQYFNREFDYSPLRGVYQVVAFAKFKHNKTVVKSNKITI